MDQRFLIIIIIIFLLSNNFYTVFKDIFKNFVYLILILVIINIISPNINTIIKENIIKIINGETSIYNKVLRLIVSYLRKLIMTSFYYNNTNDDDEISLSSNSTNLSSIENKINNMISSQNIIK
jgi:hypothetical protein